MASNSENMSWLDWGRKMFWPSESKKTVREQLNMSETDFQNRELDSEGYQTMFNQENVKKPVVTSEKEMPINMTMSHLKSIATENTKSRNKIDEVLTEMKKDLERLELETKSKAVGHSAQTETNKVKFATELNGMPRPKFDTTQTTEPSGHDNSQIRGLNTKPENESLGSNNTIR